MNHIFQFDEELISTRMCSLSKAEKDFCVFTFFMSLPCGQTISKDHLIAQDAPPLLIKGMMNLAIAEFREKFEEEVSKYSAHKRLEIIAQTGGPDL